MFVAARARSGQHTNLTELQLMDCLPGFQINETLRVLQTKTASELVVGTPVSSPYNVSQGFCHNPAANVLQTTYIERHRSRGEKRHIISLEDQRIYKQVIRVARARTEDEWIAEFRRPLYPDELALMHHVMGAALKKTMRSLGIRMSCKERKMKEFLRKVFRVIFHFFSFLCFWSTCLTI